MRTPEYHTLATNIRNNESKEKNIHETKVAVHIGGDRRNEVTLVAYTFRAPKRHKLIAVSFPVGLPELSASISHLGWTKG